MTEKDKTDWLNLCDYVKYEILEYDKTLKFPQQLVLRLKGLSAGQFIINTNAQIQAEYSYETILFTFKICKSKIKNYLHDNSTKIKDENHKINIIMLFVEKEINDVYKRLTQSQKSIEKVENSDMSNQLNDSAEYTPKSTETNIKLKNLW